MATKEITAAEVVKLQLLQQWRNTPQTQELLKMLAKRREKMISAAEFHSSAGDRHATTTVLGKSAELKTLIEMISSSDELAV